MRALLAGDERQAPTGLTIRSPRSYADHSERHAIPVAPGLNETPQRISSRYFFLRRSLPITS